MLSLTGAPALVAYRLTELACVRDVVRELLTLSKQRMAARSSRPSSIFAMGDFFFLSSKGLHVHSQRCKHLRDRRRGPFQVLKKVGLKSYRLIIPHGCRLHPLFHCDLLSKAYSSTPLRHQFVEIESDHNEYAIDYISDAKVDNRPNRRGFYVQFLAHFAGYDVPEWVLLEQVDDCEQLSMFLSSYIWAQFSQTQPYIQFNTRYAARDANLHKWHIIDFSLKGRVLWGEGCSDTAIVIPHATLLRIGSKSLKTLTIPYEMK